MGNMCAPHLETAQIGTIRGHLVTRERFQLTTDPLQKKAFDKQMNP